MGPVTTVIIPVRNGATYICEAMASALDQLDPRDELMVVDDASTDDTTARVLKFGDPRVRTLPTPRRGVSAARNVGFQAARGQLIAFLDHDDLWCPGRHQVLLTALLNNPDVDAAFGKLRIRIEPEGMPFSRYIVMDGTFGENSCVSCGLFRRGILERVGGFAEDMRCGEDTDHLMRMRELGIRVALCDIDSLVYRRHGSNATNDVRAMRDGYFEVFRRRIARVHPRSHHFLTA